MNPRLLLYKTGETDPNLVDDIGDYERWFARVLGGDATLEIAPRVRRAAPPALRLRRHGDHRIAALARRAEPWMDDAADFVRAADDAGVPVLGVCFGHQLVGHAYGGRVRMNPNGWEVGTVEVELTDEGARDPLFVGLPARLRVNQSHRDEVGTLGPETRRLAGGAHTPNQAIAVGAHVRGVQFHPEMNAPVIRRIIAHRRVILEADAARRGAPEAVAAQLAGSGDTPDAESRPAQLRRPLRPRRLTDTNL